MGYPTDDDFRELHGWDSTPPKLTIKLTTKKKSKKVRRVVLGTGILVSNNLSYAIVDIALSKYWHEVYPGKKVKLIAEVSK